MPYVAAAILAGGQRPGRSGGQSLFEKGSVGRQTRSWVEKAVSIIDSLGDESGRTVRSS